MICYSVLITLIVLKFEMMTFFFLKSNDEIKYNLSAFGRFDDLKSRKMKMINLKIKSNLVEMKDDEHYLEKYDEILNFIDYR